ncbi:complement receptor type 2 isoform X2 [Amia ocellicauda]|uniref:complement receptor type 2 isoform X2 n=1 Tax=Amia ocellicauda TaxID=2972642 RepID=UPI003463A6E7
MLEMDSSPMRHHVWRNTVCLLLLSVTRVLCYCTAPPSYTNVLLRDRHPTRSRYPSDAKVIYTCAEGYIRAGGSWAVFCINGKWTTLTLNCERRSCGSAGEIQNGQFKYNGILFGDTVVAECEVGYQLVGRGYRQCKSTGWDGIIPICESVKCADPPEAAGLRRTGPLEGPFDYNTVLSYSCERGTLIGNREIHCNQNGDWSSPPPQCTDINCPAPYLKNGRLTSGFSVLFKYRATVSFACHAGYELNGARWITCEKDGRWHPEIPKCELREVYCPRPSVLNGRRTSGYRSMYKHGDSATFSCNPGYRRSGAVLITCGEDGRWAPEIPQCLEVYCPAPSVTNGSITHGYNIKYEYRHTVLFACNAGYQLHGADLITCEEDGHWLPKIPECLPLKEITCAAPSVTDSTVTHGGKDIYQDGDSVTLSCDEGFVLNGHSTVSCGGNGEWSPPVPTCQALNRPFCSAPPPHPNAKPTEKKPTYSTGQMVMYKCVVGYKREGGSLYIRCNDGQWTPLTLQCEKKSCGSAGEILNGMFKYEDITFGSKATAVCDEGYRLVGRGYRQCKDLGWDGDIPLCEVAKCPAPRKAAGLRRTGPQEGPFDYNTVLSYSCERGTLIGSREIYCTENGTWSGPLPKCKEINCTNPIVRNARKTRGHGVAYTYRDSVSFACEKGFRLNGSGSVTCNQYGKWSPRLPKCDRVVCPPPVLPNGGIKSRSKNLNTHGCIVHFYCDAGYRLQGSGRVTCGDNGQWHPSLPTCTKRYRSYSRY